jgi:uncharacterized membrane protein
MNVRRVRRWLWAPCAMAALLSGADASACESDVDCKGDRICQAGKCVNAGTPAPTPAPPAPATAAPPAAAPPPTSERPRPYAIAPLPPLAPREPHRAYERSVGLMVTGFVTLGIGVIATPIGVAMMVASSESGSCVEPDGSIGATYINCTDEEVAVPATVMTAVGAALIGVGIPLAIVGLQKEPSDGVELAVVPELRVGPTSASAAWSF